MTSFNRMTGTTRTKRASGISLVKSPEERAIAFSVAYLAFKWQTEPATADQFADEVLRRGQMPEYLPDGKPNPESTAGMFKDHPPANSNQLQRDAIIQAFCGQSGTLERVQSAISRAGFYRDMLDAAKQLPKDDAERDALIENNENNLKVCAAYAKLFPGVQTVKFQGVSEISALKPFTDKDRESLNLESQRVRDKVAATKLQAAATKGK